MRYSIGRNFTSFRVNGMGRTTFSGWRETAHYNSQGQGLDRNAFGHRRIVAVILILLAGIAVDKVLGVGRSCFVRKSVLRFSF